MGVYAGPEINESGLVLCLDAGNTKSYPGSGTAWTDLSGRGNNGTLVGSPTYSSNDLLGSITTNTSQYISTGYNFSNNKFTVNMFVKLNPSTFWATVWANDSWTAARGYLSYMDTSSTLQTGAAGQLPPVRQTTITGFTSITNWCWVIDGTTLTLYKNGIQVDSGSFTAPSGGFATTGLYFGARHQNTGTSFADVCPMVLYTASVYNRTLSATEVSQNFNAMRGRFGI
jgi:hypothetical protein